MIEGAPFGWKLDDTELAVVEVDMDGNDDELPMDDPELDAVTAGPIR